MAPRRKTRKTSLSFGNVRRVRPTREYVQIPMVRGRQRKRIAYSAKAASGGMMPCTRLYAKSLLDPSGEDSKGACLPCGFPMPSQKIRAFVRGTMFAQPNNTTLATTTGYNGFIVYRPTLAGDVSCATVTNQALPTGPTNITTAFNSPNWGIFNQNMTKLPFLAAAFTANNVEGRLVSACVRIRYAGLEDARSGVIYLFEDPDHISLSTQSTNTISTYDSCGVQRPSGDGTWHQINWSGPAKQSETEYVIDDGAAAPTAGAFAPACIVISVIGVNPINSGSALAPPAIPFEYEIWQNLEYIGRDAIGKTNNKLDEQGAKNVFAAAKIAQSQSEPLAPTGPGAVTFKEELKKAAGLMASGAFKGRPGGSPAGNLLQAILRRANPGLAAVHQSFRGYGSRIR